MDHHDHRGKKALLTLVGILSTGQVVSLLLAHSDTSFVGVTRVVTLSKVRQESVVDIVQVASEEVGSIDDGNLGLRSSERLEQEEVVWSSAW